MWFILHTGCEAEITSNFVLVLELISVLHYKTAVSQKLFRRYITRRCSARKLEMILQYVFGVCNITIYHIKRSCKYVNVYVECLEVLPKIYFSETYTCTAAALHQHARRIRRSTLCRTVCCWSSVNSEEFVGRF